ncbi:unnamed protein product [Victoria cruziana]
MVFQAGRDSEKPELEGTENLESWGALSLQRKRTGSCSEAACAFGKLEAVWGRTRKSHEQESMASSGFSWSLRCLSTRCIAFDLSTGL